MKNYFKTQLSDMQKAEAYYGNLETYNMFNGASLQAVQDKDMLYIGFYAFTTGFMHFTMDNSRQRHVVHWFLCVHYGLHALHYGQFKTKTFCPLVSTRTCTKVQAVSTRFTMGSSRQRHVDHWFLPIHAEVVWHVYGKIKVSVQLFLAMFYAWTLLRRRPAVPGCTFEI